jgi:hypothetical protein
MEFYHAPHGAIDPITAMDARHAAALTTTLVRAKNLLFDGYSIDAGDMPGLFTVTGQPTTKKKTGEEVAHGPYDVDTNAGTCTCPAFANYGDCKHLACCRDLEAGNVPEFAEALEEVLWALQRPDSELKRATEEGLLYVYRSEGLARNDCRALRSVLGVVEPVAVHLTGILESGRYSGLRLVMRSGMETIWFSAVEKPGRVPAPVRRERPGDGVPEAWRPTGPIAASRPVPSRAELAEMAGGDF